MDGIIFPVTFEIPGIVLLVPGQVFFRSAEGLDLLFVPGESGDPAFIKKLVEAGGWGVFCHAVGQQVNEGVAVYGKAAKFFGQESYLNGVTTIRNDDDIFFEVVIEGYLWIKDAIIGQGAGEGSIGLEEGVALGVVVVAGVESAVIETCFGGIAAGIEEYGVGKGNAVGRRPVDLRGAGGLGMSIRY